MWCGLGAAQARYWGRELGALSQLHHGVRGRLFAVDARTIYLQDFHYDGEGPGTYILPIYIHLVAGKLLTPSRYKYGKQYKLTCNNNYKSKSQMFATVSKGTPFCGIISIVQMKV